MIQTYLYSFRTCGVVSDDAFIPGAQMEVLATHEIAGAVGAHGTNGLIAFHDFVQLHGGRIACTQDGDHEWCIQIWW